MFFTGFMFRELAIQRHFLELCLSFPIWIETWIETKSLGTYKPSVGLNLFTDGWYPNPKPFVLVHLGCYERILQTTWLINNRHSFFRYLEAGVQNWVSTQTRSLMRTCFQSSESSQCVRRLFCLVRGHSLNKALSNKVCLLRALIPFWGPHLMNSPPPPKAPYPNPCTQQRQDSNIWV